MWKIKETSKNMLEVSIKGWEDTALNYMDRVKCDGNYFFECPMRNSS